MTRKNDICCCCRVLSWPSSLLLFGCVSFSEVLLGCSACGARGSVGLFRVPFGGAHQARRLFLKHPTNLNCILLLLSFVFMPEHDLAFVEAQLRNAAAVIKLTLSANLMSCKTSLLFSTWQFSRRTQSKTCEIDNADKRKQFRKRGPMNSNRKADKFREISTV